MKAQKVDDVKFEIEKEHRDLKFDILKKEGGLFLSLSNLFFKSDQKWYEIPLDKLEKIEVVQKDPPKLEFRIPSMKITVMGGYAEKLLALRHLLLPYVKHEGDEEEPLLAILKLWGLGIQNINTISDLLGLKYSEVRNYIEDAENDGLIKDGEITEKAKRVLKDDGDFMKALEA
ncbi:MAG: hypothetical protein ACQEQM_05770 [Thermoplasmatota archaeon]